MSKNTQLGNLVNGIYVDSTGKVGVGTTSPSAPLHVFTTGAVTAQFTRDLATDSTLRILSDNDGAIIDTQGIHTMRFFTSDTERMRIASDGVVSVTNNTGAIFKTTSGTRSIQLESYAADWSYLVSAGNNLGINVGGANALVINTNGAERMRITSAGKVGINNNSPSAKFEVLSGYDSAAYFKCTNNEVPVSLINTENSVASIGFKGSTSSNEYNVRCGANGENFVLYTSNTEKMRILSNGNVGIGNTSPSTKLHVTGTISSSDLLLAGTLDYSYTTSDSWTSWQTIVPTGALTSQAVYIIRIWYGTDNAPWTVATSFLFSPANTNGPNADGQFAPMISTHQGGTGVIYVRARATWGSVAGLDAYFSGFTKNTGSLSIKVVRLM